MKGLATALLAAPAGRQVTGVQEVRSKTRGRMQGVSSMTRGRRQGETLLISVGSVSWCRSRSGSGGCAQVHRTIGQYRR